MGDGVSDTTAISWTDHTFNPWIGCQRYSDGCRYCYAETGTSRYGLDVFGHPSKRRRTSATNWRRPIKWNRAAAAVQRPARVFCGSWCDVFEDAPVPNQARPELWALIRSTTWLDWQLLTHRPENIARMLPDEWGDGWPHVWLGTTVEDNRYADRAPILTALPAFVRFVSYEPALGPPDEIPLRGVDWLICGGLSGPRWQERPLDLDWARAIRTRCDQAGVAFFFKQDSGPREGMRADALGEIAQAFPAPWERPARLELTA